MNIPQSAIDPFGVIGIPRIEDRTRDLIKNIRELSDRIDAINRKSFEELGVQPITGNAFAGWFNKK